MIRNILGYLLFLFLLGIFAILYNVYFTGVLFITAVLMPVVLFILLLYSCKKVIINLDTTTLTAGKGESLNLVIQITNQSVFPVSKLVLYLEYYNIFTGIRKKETITLTLDNKSSQNVSCQIRSDYCGNLQFLLKSIRIYDYFHISSVKKKVDQEVNISVIPEIHEIPADIITENNRIPWDSDRYSDQRPGDDPSEVFNIREYNEGDRLSRIHWKLSYKEDQFMIKEFSEPINDKILLLTDFFCGQNTEKVLPYVDALLECTLSVSYTLLYYEHIHKICWIDSVQELPKILPISSFEDNYTAVEMLLKTEIKKERRSILREYTVIRQDRCTHMIYITSVVEKEELLTWSKDNPETHLLLFYVNDLDIAPLTESQKELSEECGIKVIEIDIKNTKESLLAFQGF